MNLKELGLLGLAFSSGLVSFLNPCSFALLPAYLSYFLGKEDNYSVEAVVWVDALNGIRVGVLTILGFGTIFGLIGVLVSFVGSQIGVYFPQFLLFIGPILVLTGLLWLTGRLDLYPNILSDKINLHESSFFLFGVVYGLSSMTCVFPVFLMIILTAISTGGFFLGIMVFFFYTLGMGGMMLLISVAIAFSKKALLFKMRIASKQMKKVSGIILIVTGIYIIYYWYTMF